MFDFSELDESVGNKSIKQLEIELKYQLLNGELPGGTICSYIKYRINLLHQQSELTGLLNHKQT